MDKQDKTRRLIKWAGTGIKYGFGVLCWHVLFVFLRIQCIFNVESFVDSLWMKNLHDDLVKNMAGEVAYRAGQGYGDFGCGDKYIYSVRYHPKGSDGKGEIRSLGSLVDILTWRFTEVDGIFAYYLDSKHIYRVRWISDGTDIFVEDR